MRLSKLTLPALAALTIAGLGSGCGLIENEDALDITYNEEIPVEFVINADELCPTDLDCDMPAGEAQQDLELAELTYDIDLDVVEITSNPELADYAGRFKRIEITSVDYEVKGNTLNFDLPPTKMYVGTLTASKHTAQGALELTTLPAVTKMSNDSGKAPVVEENRDGISELFKGLKLSLIPYSKPVIKAGEPAPPAGKATMGLTFNVRLVANPADQVNR